MIMVKRVFVILIVLIFGYFILAGILTVTGVCPKSINFMPKVVGPGVSDIKGQNDPNFWNRLFCPFAEKTY